MHNSHPLHLNVHLNLLNYKFSLTVGFITLPDLVTVTPCVSHGVCDTGWSALLVCSFSSFCGLFAVISQLLSALRHSAGTFCRCLRFCLISPPPFGACTTNERGALYCVLTCTGPFHDFSPSSFISTASPGFNTGKSRTPCLRIASVSLKVFGSVLVPCPSLFY